MASSTSHIVSNLRRNHTLAQVSKTQPPFPIDLVYIWCGTPESSTCRYTEDLRYSMRSVTQNMPWLRRIVLVVQDDFTLPLWLAPGHDREKLRIVRVRSFMPVKYLPTANYHAISSWVHRIRGLAEHFVFMHDDMYVGRPTPYTCLFTADGVPVNRHYPGPADHGLYPDHRIPYVRMWTQAIVKHGLHNTRVQLQATACRRRLLKKYHDKYRSEVDRASRLRFYDGYNDFNLLRFATAITSTSGEAMLVKTDEYDWKKIRRDNGGVVDYFVEADDREGIRTIMKMKPRFFIVNNSAMIYSHVYDTLAKLFPYRKSHWERKLV